MSGNSREIEPVEVMPPGVRQCLLTFVERQIHQNEVILSLVAANAAVADARLRELPHSEVANLHDQAVELNDEFNSWQALLRELATSILAGFQ